MFSSSRAADRKFNSKLLALVACLVISTTFSVAVAADASAEQKVVRVKVAKWTGKQENARTICDARLVMQPGKDSHLQFGGNGTTAPATTLRVTLNAKTDAQQVQYIVACRIAETRADGEESVLAAPQLTMPEGQEGTIRIGSDPGDGLEIALQVDSAK